MLFSTLLYLQYLGVSIQQPAAVLSWVDYYFVSIFHSEYLHSLNSQTAVIFINLLS